MTKLYKDITSENIFTFSELKNEYEIANNCEIEIDDDTMIQIIHENLWSCGGNLMILTTNNDNILSWCNLYAERMEADRVMTREEIDNSIKELYIAICENDIYILQSAKDNLYEDNTEDIELLKRLENLISV